MSNSELFNSDGVISKIFLGAIFGPDGKIPNEDLEIFDANGKIPNEDLAIFDANGKIPNADLAIFDANGVITDDLQGKSSLYLIRSFGEPTINITNGIATAAPTTIPFNTVVRNTGNSFIFSNEPNDQTFIHINKSGYYRISYNFNIVKDAQFPNANCDLYHLIAVTTDINYRIAANYTAISGDYEQIETDDTEVICQWTSTEQLNEGMTIRIAVGAVAVGEITNPAQEFNLKASLGTFPNGKTPPRAAAEIFIDKV